MGEKNEGKDPQRKTEWKPNPKLTMQIKENYDSTKPNERLTMSLKKAQQKEDKK